MGQHRNDTSPHGNPTGRTDKGSRVIDAAPHQIYQALLDESAIAKWRPPQGMSAEIYQFEPKAGGRFRMGFRYHDPEHKVRGKSSQHLDVFHGRFVELEPDKRVVEEIEFETDDPAFAGKMTVITELAPTAGGTEVRIICDNVPQGIRPEDHEAGLRSTLDNLAAYVAKK